MSKKIIGMLRSKYLNEKYKIENAYVFSNVFESDFTVLRNNGYYMEFEVKISRADFFADFRKKEKHEILRLRKANQPKYKMPNKFWFVVPDGLIKTDEIPEYAGLIYCSAYYIEIIKEAPFLHKEKLDLSSTLVQRFYDRWINERIENHKLRMSIDYLKSKATI